MLAAFKRRKLLLIVVIAVLIGGALTTIFVVSERKRPAGHREADLPQKPSAPPDLQKYRDAFAAGVDAVHRGDGADAVKHFSSFDFGPRAVEEYRLYYLATGHQLAGDPKSARATLGLLWRRNPNLAVATDVGFNLAGLYAGLASWSQAAGVYEGIVARNEPPPIEANARWQAIEKRFITGDVAALANRSREIAITNPQAAPAPDAIAVFRSLTGTAKSAALPLAPRERLTRAESLLRDGNARQALSELDALAAAAPSSIADEVALQRGIALHQLRRFEDSNKTLEPLTAKTFHVAIPALRHTSKNYRLLSASINPNITKTIREKKQKGTVKVRVKGKKGKKSRIVRKPNFVTVTRTIKLVDLAKKQKKETYERLGSERLQDLLMLKLPNPIRLEVLNTLAAIATEKKQDDYLRKLITDVVKIDPLADPGLQYFWDKGWAAYTRGDLNAARDHFRFIADTYRNPNVRRQSEYWYARSIDRLGRKDDAAAIYKRLADAPYADVYAIHSSSRGGKLRNDTSNPLKKQASPDWADVAEREMPKELRLAYELTALSNMRDARVEIQKNLSLANQKYGEALLADLYASTGNLQLMYRSIRRAWPQLATVEQDQVPAYFVRMYYPTKYHDTIREEARKRRIAPELVMALILQESYYNPKARSGVGATGLMQIMPATGKEIGRKLHGFFNVTRLEDPETNIELGTYYLGTLIRLFNGNVYLAVASYNGGQGNVMKWRRAAPSKPIDEFIESIPFPETRNYVKRVTMLRSSYARVAR